MHVTEATQRALQDKGFGEEFLAAFAGVWAAFTKPEPILHADELSAHLARDIGIIDAESGTKWRLCEPEQ